LRFFQAAADTVADGDYGMTVSWNGLVFADSRDRGRLAVDGVVVMQVESMTTAVIERND
jgi:hypothetical protein